MQINTEESTTAALLWLRSTIDPLVATMCVTVSSSPFHFGPNYMSPLLTDFWLTYPLLMGYCHSNSFAGWVIVGSCMAVWGNRQPILLELPWTKWWLHGRNWLEHDWIWLGCQICWCPNPCCQGFYFIFYSYIIHGFNFTSSPYSCVKVGLRQYLLLTFIIWHTMKSYIHLFCGLHIILRGICGA